MPLDAPASNKADLTALAERANKAEARLTASETDAAARRQALEDLKVDVHDMRSEMRAGFEATRSSIAALPAQLASRRP